MSAEYSAWLRENLAAIAFAVVGITAAGVVFWHAGTRLAGSMARHSIRTLLESPTTQALIAEAVEQARAEERERIALEIVGDAEDDWGGADFACGCSDPNPDNVPSGELETCRRTREVAARIARGEVSP